MSGNGSNWFNREGLALLTDFYELTMMAGHLKDGRTEQRVSFDYFFRAMPSHTGFAVAAGLDCFLSYLESLRFSESDLAYLKSLGVFDDAFLAYLKDFRTRCVVRAVPEGTFVFPGEPVIQVEGPILDAQLIETALLNMVNHQTLIATKAARVCLAAESDPVLEFGLRRAHGPDGGLSASRACYIGGCASTSNVLAGKVYGIPVAGTHAHSWVMGFPSELEAFRAFARLYPEHCVLLVDTYDPVKSGIPNAIKVFCEMRAQGLQARPAVRLDSGDLAKLSKICYAMMRDAGLDDPLIVASNDLNEDLIADLKRQGARINAWGVGTQLITAYDAPALPGVYKLVAIETAKGWQSRMKVTSNIEKATDPGRKHLVRYYDADGHPLGDMLYLEGEPWQQSGVVEGRSRKNPHSERRLENAATAKPLLETVFKNGRRVLPQRDLAAIRDAALEQRNRFPEEYKRLRNPEIFRVLLSTRLGEMKDAMLMNPESAE
ncbi:MAG TPA: nicotinate phosphoribosyltransferase [Candidatus Hydrogenedentes bacterium]|nr:nicotinate phosphoribosyltransferase [Candidatus Hydrogenedentota bacterium]